MTRLIPLLYLVSTFLFSCSPTGSTDHIDPHFVFCLFNKEESPTSFLFVDNLEASNKESLEIPLSTSRIREREYIQKDGFFYRLSPRNKVLSKYALQGSDLVVIDSVQLKNSSLETFVWKESHQLLIVCREDIGDRQSQARIYQVDTEVMKIGKEGTVVLPFASAEYWALHIGLVEWEQDRLWLAYSFFKSQGKYGYTTSDTSYYATIDDSTYQIESIQKEVRSTYPGGYNVIQSYSFKDEQGDYYFMTNPGIALGNNVKLPTAIFRKKSGSHEVDSTYMINVSKEIGNHAYGMWYAGKDKVVIRNEQKHLYTDFSNYHAVYQFEYRIVDLRSGKIEKIPVPLDKGTQKQNVWSDGRYIFIAIDDKYDEHRVWKYDMQTKEVAKGIKLPMTTNYIVRMDYLK